MKLWRIAQIGVGGMGLAHVRAVVASPRAELVGLCDASPEALAAAGDSLAVPRFRDLATMLDRVAADALIVCLPHYLYPRVIAEAAGRKLAILKEKPFARNLLDAQEIHNAVTAHGVKFLCAAQRQYSLPFQRAAELLAEGAVGEVFLAQGSIFYPWRLGGEWGWRGIHAQSGGIALVDSGWHVLDAMVWLKGLPSSVYCRVGAMPAGVGSREVDDKAVAVFDYPDGAIGSLTACFQTVPSTYEVRLHGTSGTLCLTPQRLTLHPRAGGEPLVVEDDGRDPIAAQLDHFLDVLEGAPPRVGVDEGLRLQRVVEAGYESAATGRAVELVW